MTVKVVTSFKALMQYAKALGTAKKSGNKEAIAKAQTEHDAYHQLCLASDEMSLGCTNGQLG